MPGLTIKTDTRATSASARGMTANPRRASTSSRHSSPPRPPISPITPTLAPSQLAGAGPASSNAPDDFALGRPIFTHTTQTDQAGIMPPPAQPIDFDTNPDVLALKSAISILQLQRARATADIQSLSRAKEAALADPEAFAADLAAGRVRMEGDPLSSGARANGDHSATDDSSSSDDDDDDGEIEEPAAVNLASETKPNGEGQVPSPPSPGAHKPAQKTKRKGKQKHKQNSIPQPPPWQTLPKPQNIVRCPPINWAQYGVVGESLDKLHAEQVAAPTPGAPAVLGPGGTYDPAAAAAAGEQQQPQRLVGVVAPYNPLRDKVVEKKGKGGRR